MVLRSVANDAKKHERTVEIPFGFKNANDVIHAQLVNDRGEIYRVSYKNGRTFTCRHEVNGKQVPCPAYAHGLRCYHVQCVELVYGLFTDDGIVAYQDAPAELKYLYSEDVEAYLAQQDKNYEEIAYAILATTKQPVSQCETKLAGLGFLRGQYHGHGLHGRAS